MANPFNRVGGLRPRRNKFNLSYRKNLTCNIGQLIPVVCDEVVPGDYVKIGNQLTVRFQPLAAPVMHELTASVHYFFVPYRLIWDQWEDFIKGPTGKNPEPAVPVLPRFVPQPNTPLNQYFNTLWDFFGMPLGPSSTAVLTTDQVHPIAFPWYAYNFVYNEYYRDVDLQDEIPLSNNIVLNRNYKKDYFTAARPFQQRGTPPALPVNMAATFNSYPIGNANRVTQAFFRSGNDVQNGRYENLGDGGSQVARLRLTNPQLAAPTPTSGNMEIFSPVNSSFTREGDLNIGINDIGLRLAPRLQFDVNSFNISDLRLAFQYQKWLERNARTGSLRYTHFLQAHFGVSPSDARLQRPEYIGGTKMPLVISEVLQTSESNFTDGHVQGGMTGHGLGADSQYAGSYNVQEYGLIIGLMSVMPKPAYQNGVNRQWLRYNPTDFYFPEFAHLSEQGIMNAEINYITQGGSGSYNNRAVFGFVGQYDEMRVKHDIVCSEMRMNVSPSAATLAYWNMSRNFPMQVYLNSDFIQCKGQDFARNFLVSDVNQLIVNCDNIIHAVRPLPLIAEPGLIDHF